MAYRKNSYDDNEVTKIKMEHIEDGIEAAHNAIDEIQQSEWKPEVGSVTEEMLSDEIKDVLGRTGKDGITPTVGKNGNWYLGDKDTGNPSRGEKGPRGEAGSKVLLADTPARTYTQAGWDSVGENGYIANWVNIANKNDFNIGDIAIIPGTIKDRNYVKCMLYVEVLEKSSTRDEFTSAKTIGFVQSGANEIQDYQSSQTKWNVVNVNNKYILSLADYTPKHLLEPYTRQTVSGNDRVAIMAYSKSPLEIPLPDPIILAGASATAEVGFAYGANISAVNNASLIYREVTNNPSIIDNAEHQFFNHWTVTGSRATPPSEPAISAGSDSQRSEVISIAQSYLDALNSGRVFGYGENFISYNGSTALNDANGRAMMECDTFISLVMSGIAYSNSAYAKYPTTQQSANYETDFIPGSQKWVLPLKSSDNALKRKLTITGALNWYFWRNKMVFTNADSVLSGDIVIFTNPDSKARKYNFFDGIGHIAIAHRYNGDLWVYHVAGGKDNVYHQRLSEVWKNTPNKSIYFARPDYTK